MSVAARYLDAQGNPIGELELASKIFEAAVQVSVMHAAVRAQLAAARAGTHSTKTRAEVRGGGRKPWRQKGTGRARHGSIREPQWVGGGVAHGPKPQDHSMRLNKKMKALALHSALSDRAGQGRIVVVDPPDFETPQTKRALELLQRWGAEGKVLLVTGRRGDVLIEAAWKSFRNLPQVLMVSFPTTYDVLGSDTVVFVRSALDELTAPGGYPMPGVRP
ncbi:MAG: 50S ribosomal protein L4 [Actinomycetota bacterium]